jgi:glucose/arabinose dehydrogenase
MKGIFRGGGAMTAVCLTLLCPTVGITAAESLERVDLDITVGGAVRRATIPAGFTLEVLAEGLEGPRMLTFAANGDLFAGSQGGYVYRFAPPYDRPEVLVRMAGYPHSVAFRKGEILVARTGGLYRAPYGPGRSRTVSAGDIELVAPLPAGRGHSSRTVRIGPDGRVYLSLGITGNCSDEYLDGSYPFERRRGGVLVLKEEGEPAWETFASGLRNPVGFDWHPDTGEMYAGNNGPDHLGFDQPPEYFSRLTRGSFHGMPWYRFDGVRVIRDECASGDPPRPLEDVVTPAATFPARSAPMSVAFARNGDLGGGFHGHAVVALRGSWGTAPTGSWRGDPATRREPRLVLVRFADGEAGRVDDLVTGFQLPGGRRWARPVGAAFAPDGALYFTSDEGANALFRLRRVD